MKVRPKSKLPPVQNQEFNLWELSQIAKTYPRDCPFGEEARWLDEYIRAHAETTERLKWRTINTRTLSELEEVERRLEWRVRQMTAIATEVGIYPANRHWFL